MNTDPKKVLFVALSGIGNFLMQSPVFEVLKKQQPSWHITVWVAPRGTKELAEVNPFVDEVLEAPIKASPFRHIQTIRTLRQKNFDIGVVLSPGQLVKSAAYLYMAEIPTRIGNSYPWRGDSESSCFLTQPVKEDPALHDIEQNLRLLEPLGIPMVREASYEVRVTDEAKKEAASILKQLNIPSDKKLIGIHAGSAPNFLWKRWPLEHFTTVARTFIKEHDAHILILGGSDENKQKTELLRLIEQQESPPREQSLRNIPGFIWLPSDPLYGAGILQGGKNVSTFSASLLATAAIMQHCEFILSNDSGLMHLAAASGVKVYGLFGPTDEKKTGPRGKNSAVIRAPGTQPVYDTEKNYNLGNEPHPSILAITPQMVFDKIA